MVPLKFLEKLYKSSTDISSKEIWLVTTIKFYVLLVSFQLNPSPAPEEKNIDYEL